VRSKDSCPVRGGAVGKVPLGNSLAAYSTARCVLRGLGEGDLAWLPGVRQAKLGASGRVKVPAEEGFTNHSYRVWQLWRKHEVKLNETVEAYTGNHGARRGARTPQSLRQPRN